jgi:hypothetical protein
MNKPPPRRRTSIVRFRGLAATLLRASLWIFLAAAPPQSFPQDEAAGWLQLESDQRRFRGRVEPLTPREERYLDHLESRQGRELRALQSEQRRERRVEERSERRREPGRRVRPEPVEPERRRELERQRLNQRIRRETFGAGRR